MRDAAGAGRAGDRANAHGRGISGEDGGHPRKARASPDADAGERSCVESKTEKPSYVYADGTVCKCLYAGTEQQYQEYRRLARERTMSDEATLVTEESSDPGAGALGTLAVDDRHGPHTPRLPQGIQWRGL